MCNACACAYQEVADAPRVMGPEALLRQKIKQHRHRGGYEDGLSTMHKVVPALAFLAASAPVEMLGQVRGMLHAGRAELGKCFWMVRCPGAGVLASQCACKNAWVGEGHATCWQG
eukprot:1156043-Pelagomonas_calceolata.AAC.17